MIQKYIERPLVYKQRKFDIRMWALLHIAQGRPTPGASKARQAGWRNRDAWFFVPLESSRVAEWYAVPTKVYMEGFATKVVQTKLRISTRQALRAGKLIAKKRWNGASENRTALSARGGNEHFHSY